MKKIFIVVSMILGLFGCAAPTELPVQTKPTKSVVTKTPKTTHKPVPTKTSTVKKPVAPKTTKSAKPPFRNCKEVFEAGTVPIYPSNPRWNPKLDRDGDGMACEH